MTRVYSVDIALFTSINPWNLTCQLFDTNNFLINFDATSIITNPPLSIAFSELIVLMPAFLHDAYTVIKEALKEREKGRERGKKAGKEKKDGKGRRDAGVAPAGTANELMGSYELSSSKFPGLFCV